MGGKLRIFRWRDGQKRTRKIKRNLELWEGRGGGKLSGVEEKYLKAGRNSRGCLQGKQEHQVRVQFFNLHMQPLESKASPAIWEKKSQESQRKRLKGSLPVRYMQIINRSVYFSVDVNIKWDLLSKAVALDRGNSEAYEHEIRVFFYNCSFRGWVGERGGGGCFTARYKPSSKDDTHILKTINKRVQRSATEAFGEAVQ